MHPTPPPPTGRHPGCRSSPRSDGQSRCLPGSRRAGLRAGLLIAVVVALGIAQINVALVLPHAAAGTPSGTSTGSPARTPAGTSTDTSAASVTGTPLGAAVGPSGGARAGPRPGGPAAATVAAVGDAVPRAGWGWPLQPRPHVVAPFDPPAGPYGPGHRGVDLAGAVGRPVLAVTAGTVTFAGQVGGLPVIVVDHGRLRTTYQPVVPLVHRGSRVRGGQPLGTLTVVGSHCLPLSCLHLGVRDGEVYLDPLGFLSLGPVRLLPLAGAVSPGRLLGGAGPAGPWPLPG
jgi:murein DD-endopeptidase MepM/ murein hydrolase activator NlpD